MKSVITLAIILGTCCGGGLFAQMPKEVARADQELLQVDHSFLQASARADKTAVSGSLDDDFTSTNDAELSIIASWQALETAVTHHDAAGWAPHVAAEFVIINANNDHPMTKA